MEKKVAEVAIKRRRPISDTIVKHPIIITLAFFVAMFIFFICVSPLNREGFNTFLSLTNLINIVEATAGFSIGAFAMTLVLLVGSIDLSAEAVISVCCAVFGTCMVTFQMGLLASVLVTIAAGLVCGGLNALLVVKFKVPAFLATIAIAFAFTGVSYTITQGTSQLIQDPALVQIFGPYGSGGIFLGIPVMLIWTVGLMIGMYFLISRSKFGRWAQATGGNQQAAYSSGVNVKMVTTVAFLIMGVFAALVGIMFCARMGAYSSAYGVDYGLKFIICAVLGGTTFEGGGGNVFGTILGSLVMGVLTNGLGILGVDTYTQQIVLGVVIVLSVVFSIFVSQKRK